MRQWAYSSNRDLMIILVCLSAFLTSDVAVWWRNEISLWIRVTLGTGVGLLYCAVLVLAFIFTLGTRFPNKVG